MRTRPALTARRSSARTNMCFSSNSSSGAGAAAPGRMSVRSSPRLTRPRLRHPAPMPHDPHTWWSKSDSFCATRNARLRLRRRVRGNGSETFFKRGETEPCYLAHHDDRGRRNTRCAATTDKAPNRVSEVHSASERVIARRPVPFGAPRISSTAVARKRAPPVFIGSLGFRAPDKAHP
jgi:hypothetical protein